MCPMEAPVLKVKNLVLAFEIDEKNYEAIKDVSLNFFPGKIHAIVGESGCGKTMSAMSIIKLLPNNAKILNGEVIFHDDNILEFCEKELRKIRGKKIALIPQDPMTSLNPLYTIENQLLETILEHRDVDKEEAYEIAVKTLKDVEISDPEKRMKAYPHELSGGMKQRVIIAMALATKAEVIIADEPTTALDVTIQAQILKLLKEIRDLGKTIILITHDLGTVSSYADEVSVMYLGKIIEQSPVRELFRNPKHPYTKALINALPSDKSKVLQNIKGQPSPITEQVSGCPFHPRCPYVMEVCKSVMPDLKFVNGTKVACWLFDKPENK